MKNKIFKLGIIISTMLICTSVILTASGGESKIKAYSYEEGVEALERQKQEIIKNGGEVPADLEKALINAKIFEEEERIGKENVARLNRERATAPRDEKGNPIIPNPLPSDDSRPHPFSDIGIYYDRDHIEILFASYIEYDKYNFTSVATSDYNKIISGSMKADAAKGVIYEIKLDPNDVMNTQRNVYEYPDVGTIVLDELFIDKNIVTFTYNQNQKGYFDLSSSTAVFDEYIEKGG